MEGSAIFAISYFIFDLRNSRLVRFTPPPLPLPLRKSSHKKHPERFPLDARSPGIFQHVFPARDPKFLSRPIDRYWKRAAKVKGTIRFFDHCRKSIGNEIDETRIEREILRSRCFFAAHFYNLETRLENCWNLPRGKRASTRRLRGSEDPLANLIINATRRYLHVNRAKYPSFPRDGVATPRARLFTTTLIKPRFSASVP